MVYKIMKSHVFETLPGRNLYSVTIILRRKRSLIRGLN